MYPRICDSLQPLPKARGLPDTSLVRTHVLTYGKIVGLAEECSDEAVEANSLFMLLKSVYVFVCFVFERVCVWFFVCDCGVGGALL